MYEVEILDADDDDGTMVDSLNSLTEAVVGHRIVKTELVAERTGSNHWGAYGPHLKITLDNGKSVWLSNTNDCCAYTELESFLLHPDKVDHIITGVGTTEYYNKWHIFADYGDVLQLNLGWSCGNPFYYGYGFSIDVEDA